MESPKYRCHETCPGVWYFDQNSFISDEGKIFKRNGEYKYYTPEAFDEVFFPKDTFSVSLRISHDKRKGESRNMRDAKTVGFAIGTDDVEQKKGGISKRLAIFDYEMHNDYYILYQRGRRDFFYLFAYTHD